jgi:dihydrofolate synthase/folylpolyglutamate synthase
MGGKNDATNVIGSNAVCVITSVGLDHTDFLGKTAAEIARNKSGIFRRDCIAVCARQSAEVMSAVEESARKIGCELEICEPVKNVVSRGLDGQDFEYMGENYSVRLCGCHQCENAAAAIQALLALRKKGFAISGADIKRGLAAAEWRGRFERISLSPTVILDGAHNPAAARVFANTAEEALRGKKLVYVFGILKDKDYREVAAITAPKAAKIITFTPPSPRALDGGILAGVCSEYAPDASVECAESPEKAVELALKAAEEIGCESAAVCAFGSLYSLERIGKAFERELTGYMKI